MFSPHPVARGIPARGCPPFPVPLAAALLALAAAVGLAGPAAAQDEPAGSADPAATSAEQIDPATSEQAEGAADEEASPEADEAPAVEEDGEDDGAQSDPGETQEPAETDEPVESGTSGEGPLLTPAVESDESQISVDSALPTAQRERGLYQLTGIYELHHNLISDEQSANDWYSYYLLRGDLNLTEHDQVSLRLDLRQDFMADPGETGLWFGDIRAYYGRSFTLSIADFPIPSKASIYLTAPTSRSSQERGYITKPTASLTFAPSFGPVTVIAQGLFQYAFARFTTSRTGSPNTQLTTGFSVQAFYAVLPWFAPSVAWETYWSVPYQTRENEGQSAQAEYYFEVAANFTVPMPEEAPSLDISLAYAQGANTLEDGITRFYFAKRDQSEVYLGLNFTY